MSDKGKETTVKEIVDQLPKLKVTDKQREFVKAAIRACVKGVLEDRFGCKVDI